MSPERAPDRVLVELLVAAPIDTVWRALRDPQEIARWFGWVYPGLPGEIEMIFLGDVEASEADHTLQMFPDRYTLEACGPDCTIVRVIRSAPVTDKSWQGIYDDAVEGWLMFTEQLRFALTRHRGADRRTLFLDGRPTHADTPLPDAIGLTRLASVPIGQRYHVTTAFGEALAGEIWFRSAHQIGLTVDGYGDGLIIVTTRPATAKSPFGSGTVVITSYGLDDAALTAVHRRWIDWWRGRYEVIDIQPPPSSR
jgi:hypothetical protein